MDRDPLSSQAGNYRTARSIWMKFGWRDSLRSIKRLIPGASQDLTNVPLRKLPVPELESTMQKYLHTLKPIVTPEQHEYAQKLVKEFLTGLGPKLQLYLVERQKIKENWAYEYWLDDMYMNVTLPLPINSNPGMVLPPRTFSSSKDMAVFAARITAGIVDFKETLERKSLPIETAMTNGTPQPLCMDQYYRLLGACRIPGRKKDSIYNPRDDTSPDDEDYVIVVKHNEFYPVLVRSPAGRVPEETLASVFSRIILSERSSTTIGRPIVPLGILTASNRRKWGEDYFKLSQDPNNLKNLTLIKKSLFVMCFDRPLPGKQFNSYMTVMDTEGVPLGHHVPNDDETRLRDETNMAHQMVHGGLSCHNTANRWFDKPLQIIISTDGVWGLCYEHSSAEGIVVINLLEGILKKIDSEPKEFVATGQGPAEPMQWNVDSDIVNSIDEASCAIDKLIKDKDYYIFRYMGFGKEFIKSCKASPDAFIQLALQLTIYRIYGSLVCTYESASTRRFQLGRVDCIRSATPEALEWAKSMCTMVTVNGILEMETFEDMGYSPAKKVTFDLNEHNDKMKLWQDAIKCQTEIMKANIMGDGIDIHLLGLRQASRDTSPTAATPLPALFAHDTYNTANKFRLSTSQVATNTDSFMGYGAVVENGYGVSYNPKTDHIIFCISSFASCPETSTSKFKSCLESSLDALKVFFERHGNVGN